MTLLVSYRIQQKTTDVSSNLCWYHPSPIVIQHSDDISTFLKVTVSAKLHFVFNQGPRPCKSQKLLKAETISSSCQKFLTNSFMILSLSFWKHAWKRQVLYGKPGRNFMANKTNIHQGNHNQHSHLEYCDKEIIRTSDIINYIIPTDSHLTVSFSG